MICNLSVGILWQIMVKLYVQCSLPLGGTVNQRSSTGAEIALFVTIVTQVVKSVIENFEMRENILYHHYYTIICSLRIVLEVQV